MRLSGAGAWVSPASRGCASFVSRISHPSFCLLALSFKCACTRLLFPFSRLAVFFLHSPMQRDTVSPLRPRRAEASQLRRWLFSRACPIRSKSVRVSSASGLESLRELSPRDRAMGAWLAVSLSKPVQTLPAHSPPATALVRKSACPEQGRRAQVRAATAHWLVFDPFGFQARFAALAAPWEP